MCFRALFGLLAGFKGVVPSCSNICSTRYMELADGAVPKAPRQPCLLKNRWPRALLSHDLLR